MSTALGTLPKEETTIALGGRMAALDGWRGVAILLVLFDHIQVCLFGHYVQPWMQTGQHGVTIFFVLSGFLITSKLIERPINLKHFYLRRFFRLMPAAWTYLAFLLLFDRLAGTHETSVAEARSCLLFFRNFYHSPGPEIGLAGHFWTLSLEEQFYLAWPCILLLAGARRCLWVAAVGSLGCATLRFFTWSASIADQSQVRADALLIGCLLALLWNDIRFRAATARWTGTLAGPAAVVLIGCMLHYHSFAPLCESVAIAVLLSTSVFNPHSALTRGVSFAPLAKLGLISYSIYLWQEFFFHLHVGPALQAVVLLIILPAFTLGSYYWIERPLTRVGHKFSGEKRVRTATA